MKAAVCKKHGKPEGIHIREVQIPAMQDDELLVKIKATTVTAGDAVLRKQKFLAWLFMWPLARLLFGIKNQRKQILGHEFAGIVEDVGINVSEYKKGDLIFGTTGFQGGAHAEYLVCNKNSIIVSKPENLEFNKAAAIPIGGISALHLLKRAGIKPGDRVLIYGASGSIGTYAVQLAKYFETEVTGVCSTANLELVKSLGADAAVDYRVEDISQSAQKYDLVFDTIGKFTKAKAKRILTEQGRYVSTHSSPVKEKKEYLEMLKELAEKGIIKAVIEREYKLSEIREVHAYVDSGRKKGNVVITIN